MYIIVAAAGLLALMVVGLFLLHGLTVRFWFVERSGDEQYRVVPADGWELGVRRYLPQGQTPGRSAERLPVVLCHGLGANHFNLDYSDGRSLAVWLAARGFDCHVVDLRGRASSAQPPPGKSRWGWSFDDYVRYDLPAIVEAVCRHAGTSQVMWVGHSMGGMVAYAYLEACAQAGRPSGIAGLVALGSPARFERMEHLRLEARLHHLLSPLPAVWLEKASVAMTPLAGWVETPGTRLVLEPGSLCGRLQRHGLANAVAPMSRGEILQFADWILNGEMRSRDDETVYFQNLHRVQVPACFVAGSHDLLARPHNVEAAYTQWGGGEKEFHLFGAGQGAPVDYGHVDLVLGDTAPEYVWPVVGRFVERHARRDSRETESQRLEPASAVA